MSRYENYAIKNNVFGTLSAPISSLATTIQLNSGQGARFSVNQLATLENVEDGKVKKREIVLITAINGDVLTVTRKYSPCPSSDDANTQGQVSYAFGADDTISAYIDKEHFDRIDDSINDIYDNGVNKLRTEVISGLQIKVNAGPILVGSGYYDFAGGTLTLTDDATNYVEIDEDGDLVANTTSWNDTNTKLSIVITSGGEVVSIDDWRLGTVGGRIGGVNIHDLTEKTSLSADDEFIVSDSENIRQNKKIKVNKILWKGTWSDFETFIATNTDIFDTVCFIKNKGVVLTPNNESRQGPAPTGYHVPSTDEHVALVDTLTALGIDTSNGNCMKTYLKMPFAGYRLYSSAGVNGQGTNAAYWSSTAYSADLAYDLNFNSAGLNPQLGGLRSNGFSVRCFKNSPTIPTVSWTTLFDGSGIAAGAGIFHNTTDGLISISSDGQNWITIADKNLGATIVYNDGDTLSEANCGKYYQWGNNYGFAWTGTITTSSTRVDASNYGPGNYYNSSTFITQSYWETSNNQNLWGNLYRPIIMS